MLEKAKDPTLINIKYRLNVALGFEQNSIFHQKCTFTINLNVYSCLQ